MSQGPKIIKEWRWGGIVASFRGDRKTLLLFGAIALNVVMWPFALGFYLGSLL